jgi:glycosyltransferase involved in cell wall biosynthesis
MTISVIVPSFGQAQYLPECIESVLDQTLAPHEIIVVDDGSTDGSLEIAKSYMPRGIKVVSQINKGLASARNTGIMNATGDYCLFLDADDMLYPNCIERITQELKLKVDIVAPSFKCFGLSNEVVILEKNPTLEMFKAGNRFGYFCAIKRSTLLEVGGYSPRMTFGWEDYALWFDLLKRGKTFSVIQEALVLYRTKENSMIHEANRHSEELMAQIHKDNPEVFT